MDIKIKDQVLVIGMGVSGKSAAELLLKKGYAVIGVDKNKEKLCNEPAIQNLMQQGLHLYHENEPFDYSSLKLAILSPGIPHTHPICLKLNSLNIEIIGEVELACRHIHQPMLGITGTNGKTTVTLLVAHVLNHAKKPARALGNVGVPLTKEVINQNHSNEIIVAELSSYQLETLKCQLIDAGVILNITPDHLDRYPNIEAYAQAKIRLSECMKPNAPLFIEERTAQEFSYLLKDMDFFTYGYGTQCTISTDLKYVYEKGCRLNLLPAQLSGHPSHDLENYLAAFAICKTQGISGDDFNEAFNSFKKPAHRMALYKEINGVAFYNDSKGTNIDAVIRAVQVLSRNNGDILLIAGGVDKGSAYTPWIKSFNDRVAWIFSIGEASDKLEMQLAHAIPVQKCNSLKEAVLSAHKKAKKGDKVLLSPGCASFDMFKDYAHRGDEFMRIIDELDSIKEGLKVRL